ncbi:M23 family metallopeptidase [Govanella unica]|uniref:M23 family metallopeptidase n=1 Tax=Govanella unica TaxID=2975056 RepID=A0A9X3Z6T6_9PROT|nr:M23 family metallopeptidase [Govania unica]MDA5193338.1 M23 family metallopeptidase [Govania unica]
MTVWARRLPVLLAALLAVFVLPAFAAEPIALKGHLTQGGLVTGQAEPGSRVTLDGRDIRLDSDGRFLFGFGRDAPEKAMLLITRSSGEIERVELAVLPRKFDIQRIDGLPETMVTPDPAALKRIALENEQVAAARKIDSDEGGVWAALANGFIRPAEGPISGVYGSQRILNGQPRQPHYGLDLAGPRGSPVRAPAAGVVTLAEHDLYYTGATVLIDHGHGLSSVLMHLDSFNVRPGERVAAGQIIGKLGASGRVTGPHLDWRVNWFDIRLDPALLLEALR